MIAGMAMRSSHKVGERRRGGAVSEQGSVVYKQIPADPWPLIARRNSPLDARHAYTVGGFEFGVDFDGESEHVDFDVSQIDINDEQFLPSLRLFVAALPVVRLRERLEMLAGGVGEGSADDVLRENDEYLRSVQEWYREVTGNEYGIAVSADVKIMMTVIDIELQRREANRASKMSVVKSPGRLNRTTRGFVYLLQSPTGYYKIGRTRDPENRARTFGVKLPFEVQFIALIETDDMVGLELELHRRFAAKRENGEWFNLDIDDIEYIKGLAS